MEIADAPILQNKKNYDYEDDKNEDEFNKRIRARIYSKVKWTKEELGWKIISLCPEKLREVMSRRIKDSVTGCFVSNWNCGKERDECQGLFTLLDLETREGRLNGWCENEDLLIKALLKESPDGFSWHHLVHYLNTIRFNRLEIAEIDRTLLNLNELKIIILMSNLIKHFNGSYLPKDVRFLELYNNILCDLSELAFDAPHKLLYLGVGRNQLTSSESLEALVNFNNLFSLDVSDNDLLVLPDCLEMLKRIPSLYSLLLYGTPCSMAISYKNLVLRELPQLLIFDGVDLRKCQNDDEKPNGNSKKLRNKNEMPKPKQIHESIKEIEDIEDQIDLTGELQVYCFRVFGVKEPKKQANVKNVYFFEIECPLLDDGLKDFVTRQAKKEDDAANRKLQTVDEGAEMGTLDAANQGEKGEKRNNYGSGKPGDKTSSRGNKGGKDEIFKDKHKNKGGKDESSRDEHSYKGGKDEMSKDKRSNKDDISRRGSRGKINNNGKSKISRGDLDELGRRRKKYSDNNRSAKIKYLFPVSKKCSERHTFNTDIIGWRQRTNKRCFLFSPNKMKWSSDSNFSDVSRSGGQKYEDKRKDLFPEGGPDGKKLSQDQDDEKDIELSENRGGSKKISLQGNKGKKSGRSDVSTSHFKKPTGEVGGVGKGKEGKTDEPQTGIKREMRTGEEVDLRKGKKGKTEESQTGVKREMSKKEQMAAAKETMKTMLHNMNALLDRDIEIEGSTKFKSKEIEWKRILEFKQPITIKTTDLLALRDTFRTVLTLRLIHTKVKLPKKDKGKRNTNKKQEMNPDNDVLLREKLAVIPVPLEAIKWNEEYLSYTWDISKPCLAEKCPDVKDMKFSKQESKKGTAKVQYQEPNILTAHIGVAVRRDVYS